MDARLYSAPAFLPPSLRGDVLPERRPAEGLLILRDGEPGEPEVTLSTPLAYHYQHRAEIEAVVQGDDRDAAFDTLCASIGAALAADRTLGGLCDWVEAGAAPRGPAGRGRGKSEGGHHRGGAALHDGRPAELSAARETGTTPAPDH